jgi:hypothetical protein
VTVSLRCQRLKGPIFSSNKNGGVRGRRLTTMDEDDGDYATLRELPLPPPMRRPENREDTVSEEGKVRA